MTTKIVPRTKRWAPRPNVELSPSQLETVPCGFCEGKGKDPFGIMSYLSTCCVCGGRGTVTLRKPYARCAYCEGTGVHPGSRLTCTACGGVGVQPFEEPNRPCPRCLGTGAELESAVHLWCLTCHGAGVVAAGG